MTRKGWLDDFAYCSHVTHERDELDRRNVNYNLQIVTFGYVNSIKVAQLPKRLLHRKNAVEWLLNFKRTRLHSQVER